jgi:hypothetical protein
LTQRPARKWRRGAAVLLVLAFACRDLESPIDPGRRQLVVHAVLDASLPVQYVIVERARTGEYSSTEVIEQEPVLGATVTITGPDGPALTGVESRNAPRDDVNFAPAFPVVVYRVSLDRPLVTGGTYRLSIRTPLGEEVTGTTTIPSVKPFQVSDSVVIRSFFRQQDTLRLSWPHVEGAGGFQVNTYASYTRYVTFSDTAVSLPGLMRTIDNEPVFPHGSNMAVIVSAVDSAYYEYYRVQSDPFAGIPPGRLRGAVGVFGSVVPFLAVGLNVN